MGGEAYWYYVPYRDDLQGALDELREREFKAGRYNPVMSSIENFGQPSFFEQNPGAEHDSIDDAIEDAAEDGTRSILDIEDIGPSPDYATASPVSATRLREVFGTDQPTRAMLDGDHALFNDIERGQCVYVIVHDGGRPTEIFFAGYSYD
jgi:hypothetical protein